MPEIAECSRCGRKIGELWRSSPVQETGRQDNVTRSVRLQQACAQHEGPKGQRLGFLLEDDDTPGTVEACIAAI